MKDFELNKYGDIAFMNQDISIIEDEKELAQCIRIILYTRLGEFTLEPEMGLLRDNMLGKHINMDYLKQDLMHAILDQEKRILSIDKIDVSINKEERTMAIYLEMTRGNNIKTSMEVNLNA